MNYVDCIYDLEIKKGESLLITGENGSGKSTLIRLILGFITPDKGLIHRKKMKISYLPEQVLLPPFIKVKAYMMGFAKVKKADIDWNLVKLLELPIDKSIHQLSKGNIQKLGLILTLMGSSDLLVFDEPLTALDDKMSEHVISHLHKVKQTGISMIISSHEPHRFISLVDQHIHL